MKTKWTNEDLDTTDFVSDNGAKGILTNSDFPDFKYTPDPPTVVDGE